MKHIPLALEKLVRSILSGKTILFTPIYSTFLQVPDTVLNSHHKLICQAFMILSQAANILDQVKLEDTRFQLSAGLIGELTGLSWSQANRALKTLSDAIKQCHKNKLFKARESVVFHLTDAEGKILKTNESGVAPYFIFEYTQPDKKLTLGGRMLPPEEKTPPTAKKSGSSSALKPEQPAPDYDKTKDIQMLDKMDELRKLIQYFNEKELEQFLPYSFDRIILVTRYYIKQLKIKTLKHGVDAQLSLKWLKDAFAKYDISPDKQLSDAMEHYNRLNRACAEVDKVITKNKIHTTFTLKHKEPPKYTHYSKLPHGNQFVVLYQKLQDKLTGEQFAELDKISAEVYELVKESMHKKGFYDKGSITGSIKQAMILKHFNII